MSWTVTYPSRARTKRTRGQHTLVALEYFFSPRGPDIRPFQKIYSSKKIHTDLPRDGKFYHQGVRVQTLAPNPAPSRRRGLSESKRHGIPRQNHVARGSGEGSRTDLPRPPQSARLENNDFVRSDLESGKSSNKFGAVRGGEWGTREHVYVVRKNMLCTGVGTRNS